MNIIDNNAAYLFHQGTNYRSYRFLGSHAEGDKVVFRLWSPHAVSVSVIGDFNGWDKDAAPMSLLKEQNIWQAELADVQAGHYYKYLIETADGRFLEKADPYAFYGEAKGNAASVYYPLNFAWDDEDWLNYRAAADFHRQPLNIYEVHLGSWRRYPDGRFYNYRHCADELLPYVKSMGYTHIELMPLSEYPYEGSWGYQVTGFFSLTSRYGSPEDFAYLVNLAHKMGIGVLLDWVPAHFPKDAHGLFEFDGQPLYECLGKDRQEHPVWGTRKFDFGRTEIQSFLISAAVFWLDLYHIDGLRVDAVSSMLYLDYDLQDGQWTPNSYGGRENLDALAFLRKLNTQIHSLYPDVLMIAEESTSWDMVSGPVQNGGLGFDYKWNMGWMNDVLSYIETDGIYRQYQHNKLTFSLVYAFSEHFILPISHDEVVHGKKSLLDKFPGEYEQKFAGLRAFICYMMAHPGKKLIFMGTELAQFKEWDYQGQLDWLLLDYPLHRITQEFFREINHFYLQNRPLWQIDDNWQGFKWIFADDKQRNLLSFRRIDESGKEIIVVVNFSLSPWPAYRLGVPTPGKYRLIFNSDDQRFGGGSQTGQLIASKPIACHGLKNSVVLDLPALSAFFLIKEEKKRIKI